MNESPTVTDPLVLPFSQDAPLALVGGKGQSLTRLFNAGIPVPNGHILTTKAYEQFVGAHRLRDRVLKASLPQVRSGKLDFSEAAATIHGFFASHELPAELNGPIRDLFANLDGPNQALAVRSSAIAEDQPEHSFAGQHASYLDINGFEALTRAIKNTWASLWSEQALSYRFQNGISNSDVAMATVVQRLISADVAGVLFTANPVTGARDEIHVNASYGLGENVVSGIVDPDEFVLDYNSFSVKSTRLGTKKSTKNRRDSPENHSHSASPEQANIACLSSTQLKTLGKCAKNIQMLFDGTPLDIEWAFKADELWILQARVITSLPPEPLRDIRWDPPEPGAYLQRTQWVEHVPDPVCTLFEDLHMRRSMQEAWGRNLIRLGNHDFEDTQPPASFWLTTTVNGFAYRQVGEPPRSGKPTSEPNKRRGAFFRFWSKLRVYTTFVPKWRYIALPRYLKQIRTWRQLVPSTASLEQLWKGIRTLSKADAAYWFNGGVWNAFSLSRGTEAQLQNFLEKYGENQFSSGQFLSGLKSAALDGQAALFNIAQQIRSRNQLYDSLIKHPHQNMLEILASLPDTDSIQSALDAYFTHYGHQVRTLDFSAQLESEDAFNTTLSLHNYLLNPELDPIKVRNQLKQAQKRIHRSASQFFRGKQKLMFYWRVWLARRFYPYREAAMSYLGSAWQVLRPLTLELGQRLVERDTLHNPEDVFYLTTEELGRAIRSLVAIDRLPAAHRKAHYPQGASLPELAEKAIERRILRSRRMNLNPPKLIPGPPPWASLEVPRSGKATPNLMQGSPVSPGRVTGEACVIRSVEEFTQLRPGTILVCPTTTPVWTVIFPQVVGLVTDIGGILAHGSIVAREFGIPAVLGLVDATQKIQDGQIITVDGNMGTVQID